jgi:hypothetical protein
VTSRPGLTGILTRTSYWWCCRYLEQGHVSWSRVMETLEHHPSLVEGKKLVFDWKPML